MTGGLFRGVFLDFFFGWLDGRIATPHAAVTHFLDCFLDFNDIEATHVRREREFFLLPSLLGLRLRCLLLPLSFNAPLLVER